MAPANGLLDCWVETHFASGCDQDPGFTFNAATNTMIKRYIPGETRRMRLDRILCLQGAAFAPSNPCRIWAADTVDEQRELCISDHYGLAVDLDLVEGGGKFSGAPEVRQLLEANGCRALEEHTMTAGRVAAFVTHLFWLLLRGLGLW